MRTAKSYIVPGTGKPVWLLTRFQTRELVKRMRADGYPASCIIKKSVGHVRFGPQVTPDHLPALRMLYPQLCHCHCLLDIPEET